MVSILLLYLQPAVFAQEALSVFVLPAYNPAISAATGRSIAHEFSAHITTREDFMECNPDSVKALLTAISPKAIYSDEELLDIGRKLNADYLFLPVIQKNVNTHEFKVSLFDVRIGLTTKVAVQNCECNFENISGFPFRRVADLLFEAPELDLTAEIGEHSPPAMLPVMPAMLPTADLTGTKGKSKMTGNSTEHKRSWKKYLASAVVVSGGVLYLTVVKKPDNGGLRGKLDDPPAPPGTN